MKTAQDRKNLADWKRTATQSLQEKLSLWAMLGVAHRALTKMDTLEATKTLQEMEAIAKKYELAGLLREMAKQHSFEVGPIGDVAFAVKGPMDEELALEIELIEQELKEREVKQA